MRPWIEWVDSADNPSVGLSRLGLEDSWAQAQGLILSEVPFPPEVQFVARPEDLQPFMIL